MIPWIASRLINFSDVLNRVFDPFEKTYYPEYVTDLKALDSQFYQHMIEKFVEDGKFRYQLPMPPDHGDEALYQGFYLALECIRPGSEMVKSQQALIALSNLFDQGRLMRGKNIDGTWNDTTSNDSATGAIFGLHHAIRMNMIGARTILSLWVSNIVKNEYALVDLNNKPTKYGKLEDGIKSDPLRITLLLAILKEASFIDGKFETHYKKLYKKYYDFLAYPKVKIFWLDTEYDTQRAAIHLNILYTLTKDEVYKQGLRRLHKICWKSNNAFVEALCAGAVPSCELDFDILKTFTLQHKLKGNVETINSDWAPQVKWGKHIRCAYALPIDKRGSQEFLWSRNMFSLDEWVGFKEPVVYHSGLDYLLAYNIALTQNLL